MPSGQNEVNYRRSITNNIDQCSRTSSFPVQVLSPNKDYSYGQNDRTLYNKIQSMYSKTPIKDDCPFSLVSNASSSSGFDVVSKSIEHTPVSSLFFSKTNIDALQSGISNKVWNSSGGRYNIGKQSEIELKIVMRSIYFDYLKNGFRNLTLHSSTNPINTFDTDVIYTVKTLNTGVLNWCSKEIITNLEQFEYYKKTIESDGYLDPMDRSIYTSSAGKKTLGQLKM